MTTEKELDEVLIRFREELRKKNWNHYELMGLIRMLEVNILDGFFEPQKSRKFINKE